MNAIEVRGLTKAYGDFEAVRGIDFEVATGEIFAFLGPNGAGKTTTVEILEGYRPRSEGNVSVLGFDPSDDSREFRSKIGIVLQECGFPRFASVRELLVLQAAYYPLPRPVDEVIELVGLAEKRDSIVRSLSGGQQRRLDLALALVGNPDLIFLDEPTTGFDPGARREAWEAIKNLRDLGKTVFLTTHYMEEAQYLADQVAVIANGEIIAQGPPETIGGRDSAATEIRFQLPLGVATNAVPEIGEEIEIEGSSVLIRAAKGVRAVHDLTGWALDNGHDLIDLTVSQPTLEDVYLELTAAADIR